MLVNRRFHVRVDDASELFIGFIIKYTQAKNFFLLDDTEYSTQIIEARAAGMANLLPTTLV